MRCPNCGTEVAPGETFCGNCGTRMAPAAPPPVAPTVPMAPPKKGGLPVVPIVIGAIILLVVACLCVVVAGLAGVSGLAGLCAAIPDVSTVVPTKATLLTPRPTVGLPPRTPGKTTVVAPATPVKPTIGVPSTAVRSTPSSGGGGAWTLSYVFRTNALSSSSVEIMGEAVNTSSQEVNTGWVEVLVTLKDKSGNVVSSSKPLITGLQRPIVQAGQKSCFRYFFGATDYGFDLTKVDKLEAEVRPAAAGHDAYTVELATSNVKHSGNAITGDITNNTQFTTRSIFILVSLYDSSGKIAGIHYGTVVGSEAMKPGDKMGLTYNVLSTEASDSFDVLVIAYKE